VPLQSFESPLTIIQRAVTKMSDSMSAPMSDGFCDESMCESTDLPSLIEYGKECDGDICTPAECCAEGKE